MLIKYTKFCTIFIIAPIQTKKTQLNICVFTSLLSGVLI